MAFCQGWQTPCAPRRLRDAHGGLGQRLVLVEHAVKRAMRLDVYQPCSATSGDLLKRTHLFEN